MGLVCVCHPYLPAIFTGACRACDARSAYFLSPASLSLSKTMIYPRLRIEQYGHSQDDFAKRFRRRKRFPVFKVRERKRKRVR